MKKLISMTDFVLEQEKDVNLGFKQFTKNVYNYANFLKQPLELWMFVPCDEDGNVLEERLIENYENDFGLISDFKNYNKKYYEAKECCLLEGLDLSHARLYIDLFYNIEALSNLNKAVNLQLTQTAINQIGL